ncbi:cyclin-D2-1-like [Musa acuminata AAA Group]|uniref:cyclin-D2-1-like n=1 Tax=Musa acuminata AAA Group TaxID=214697 RepID=UPI0031E2FE92
MQLTHYKDLGSCSDLLCDEDASELADDSPDRSRDAEFPDDSDESIAGFIEGEADYTPGFDYPARFRSNSLDSTSRREAVAWILKVSAYYRFQDLTPYLAVNYMDRFLASHRLPQNVWALQLLSVASLSLAAKMEETLVPTLLDLQIEGAEFVFEPRTIRRMELLVLGALGWRLRSVTPFTYMDFFACKLDPSGKSATYLISCASSIILATLHDIEFLSHCPSSLAAAAIIRAAEDVADLALIDAGIAVSWCIGLTEDGIGNCYRLMRRVAEGAMLKNPLVNMGSRVSPASLPPAKRRRKMSIGGRIS